MYILTLVFLVILSGLEFAYSQAPTELRGVVMGMNLAMHGIGSFLAGAFTSAAKAMSGGSWYPQDFNRGSLENYLFFLAGLLLINLLVFLVLSSKYKYVTTSSGYQPLECEDVEKRKSTGSSKN